MGVRINERPRNGNVIALHSNDFAPEVDDTGPELCAEMAGDALSAVRLEDAPLPEPAQLYGLTVLAFLLHTPTSGRARQWCVRCGVVWPCDHLRLAYRLREGF
jgi:hypothetical protein